MIQRTENCRHLLIRNALNVTALSHMIAYGILDHLNHRQEFSSLPDKTDICSENLIQLLKTTSKSEVYSRKDSSVAKPAYMDCHGNTPLHRAVGVYGHIKMYRVSVDVARTVEFLVKRGADINAQNNDGLTPLHVARGEQAMKACLQHADDRSFTVVDNRGRNFWHLLFLSRSQNEAELGTNVRSLLVDSDGKYNVDDLNRTALHYACMDRNGWIAERRWLAEEFIDKFSAEHIDKQDKFGRTALHYAAMGDNSKLMELLRTKKADDTVRDNFEKTASQYQDAQFNYELNVSLLRLSDTSSFVASHFRSISVCVQQCFFDTTHILEKVSEPELLKIIHNLRVCSGSSFVLNTLRGCRFDYTDGCRKTTALKQHICEHVEVVTDIVNATQLPSMFVAIQSEVDKAMEYLAEEISREDGRFACELIAVGSAYEKSKTGCCDEFDYNFVLTDLSRRCNVYSSPESPPGFVLLKASTPAYDKVLFNDNGILNIRIVKFRFETLVKKVLSSYNFCNDTGFEFFDFVQFYCLSPGTTSTKLHQHIKL